MRKLAFLVGLGLGFVLAGCKSQPGSTTPTAGSGPDGASGEGTSGPTSPTAGASPSGGNTNGGNTNGGSPAGGSATSGGNTNGGSPAGGSATSGGHSNGGSGGEATAPVTPGDPARACPDVGLEESRSTIRYVCNCEDGADADCQPGDDGALGSLPGSPWRSYGKARGEFAALPAGSTVAFCRGGGFTVGEQTRWVNENCRANDRCIVRDYTPPWVSGDEGRPIINAPIAAAFSLEDPANATHDEGYVFLNLALRGYDTGDGFFFYNDVDDVLVCNVSVDHFGIGVHVEGGNPPDPGSDGENARIVLRSSSITNNSVQGWLGGCSGCSIEYNFFDNNGYGRALVNHNIYISHPSEAPVVNMRAVGNELYRSVIVDGECAGTSLVVHGVHDGLLIEDNLVREDADRVAQSCWGIAIDPGYSSAESFRNVTIRGNTVLNVGNVGIGVAACDTCTIENNVVIQEHGIKFVGGISVPNRSRGGDDLALNRITIRNNSVIVGSASGGTAIKLGTEGSGHVVVSNAISYLGSSSDWNCFDLPLALSAYQAVDFNLCNAAAGEWVQGQGGLAAWSDESGFDAASSEATPQFTSVATGEYDLTPASADSPLVGNGSPELSAPTAIDGLDRDTAPDIGAFEWHAGAAATP